MADGTSTHQFVTTYPRGTWPVYTCTVCHGVFSPTAEERRSDTPPAFWTSACVAPPPLTADDIAWLTGTGRFRQ